MRLYLLLATIAVITLSSSFAQKKKVKRHKQLPNYFVEIPKGYVWDNLHIVGLNIFVNSNPTKDSTETFYISETEVTNRQYQLYLSSLRQKGQEKAYQLAKPDTLVWKAELKQFEPYAKYYFQHPAYKHYPVIGISKKQAEDYCCWLTDSLTRQNKGLNVTVRLPERKEWIRAARGDSKSQYYSMPGTRLTNNKGLHYYNHRVVGEHNIYKDPASSQFMVIPRSSMFYDDTADGALITTKVSSYWPNEFGLYNMCGNVAELIANDTIALGGSWIDPGFDIRIESEKPAHQPSCLIGFRVVASIQSDE